MRNFLLLIAIIFIGYGNSFASHLMGAEITYVHVGGNDYEVTLIVYGDCSGIAVGTTQTVTFESASCGQNFGFSIPFIQTIDVSQVCPGQTTTCNSGTVPGTEQNVFRGIVTLTPCSDWIMHWNSGSRNPAITNLLNASSTNLYIQNTLNNIIGTNNNSPQFFNMPTPYLCANNLAIYSHAASDPDGDSLYYTLAQPLNTPGPPGTPIPYNAGYSLLQPVITTAGLTLDQTTGEMCFTPSQAQVVVISVIIEEFRNGILIGTQIREMQVVIDGACTNSNPTTGVAASCGGAATLTITQQGPTVIQTDANSVVMCPNDNVCFEVNFSDPDGDNITLSSNIAAAIPTATFTVANNGTPNPIATFCWSPTPLDSGLNVFAIIATDDACPISGTQSFVFDVTVFDQPYAGLDQIICGAQQAQLNASGGAGYTWSVISGDPIVVGTNFSCVNCTSPLASPSITTSYLLTSSLSAACVNTDTVVVVVVPDIIPTAIGDTLLCDFLTHPIGVNIIPAAGAYAYSWSPAATLSNPNISNPVASPTQTTSYVVTVTSPLGCVKSDSVLVSVSPPPSATLVPGDTTICAGDVLQFDVSLTAIEDNFTGTFDPAVWSTVSGASVGTPCEAFNGTALNFDAGTRELTTNSANVASCTSIDFCMWVGNDVSTGPTGCENADPGEDIELNYSINGGASWITIQTFLTGDWDASGPYPNSWQCFSIPIPAGAATANTMFQWIQIGPYGGTIDNWALDNIAIVCGGNTNYTYNWGPTTGLSNSTINDPIATVPTTTLYTVTLTDTGGCSVDRFQTITVVPNYTITTTQSDTSVCLGETVSFTVTESMVGTFNYSWTPVGIMNNPNISNPTATFNTPGVEMIIVTVDNGGGCSKIDTLYVNVAAAVAPNINILTPDSFMACGDSILIDLDLGGGIPAMCGPSATTACSQPATNSTVGTASGANGTSSWPAPFGHWYRNAKHQFLYTAAELNAMGIMGGKITEIAWEITAINGTTTYTNYEMKMGCTSTTSLTTWETGLTQVLNPTTVNIVVGTNVLVLDIAYEWDGISNLVIEICSGDLAIAYTNNSITPWTTTTFNSSLFYFSDTQAACPTTTQTTSTDRPVTRFTWCPTIPDPNAFTYSWTPNTTIMTSTMQNPTVFPSIPTTYVVTVTDLGGSCSDTDTLNVDVLCGACYLPAISVVNPTCKDGTNGSIVINPTFVLDSEVQSFIWQDSITGVILQTTPNLITGMTDSLINIGAGAYTLTMIDTSGCSQDTTIYIIDPDSVTISSTTSSAGALICIGGSSQVDAIAIDGNGGPYTYTWNDLTTGTPIPGNGPHTVNPILPTNNCYSVFATDPLGCISSTSQVCIDLFPSIIATTPNGSEYNTLTICPGTADNGPSSTDIEMSAIGGMGAPYTYTWYENGTLIGTNSNGIINVTPTSAPTTYIGVAMDNCTTPADSVWVTVEWFDIIVPDFIRNKPDSCYSNNPIEFTDTSTPTNLVDFPLSSWVFSDGTSLNGNPVSASFNSPVCRDLTLTSVTNDGCRFSLTRVDYVCPDDYPSANFSMNPPITDLLNTDVQFTNLTTGGTPPLNYLWNFNSGLTPDTSAITHPNFTFTDTAPDTYPVLLTATDANGCQDTIVGTVVVNGIYLFYVPNSFTPDGDGLNDMFRPYGEGIDFNNYTMQIFDRWGGLIYQSSNAERGWDGTYKGKTLSAGSYVWKIIAREKYGTVIHDNFGHVNLIR